MEEKIWTVLIVDDEELNRKMLVACLQDTGFNTIEAATGMEALDILKNSDPSDFGAILLDKIMPGLDGFEVLRQMKDLDGIRDIPVILQTAADKEEDLVEGIGLGAFYYLTKPYHPPVISSIVTAAVNSQIFYTDLRDQVADSKSCLRFLNHGSFNIRSLDEANDIAAEIATVCPDPEAAVLGIGELLINAIEHGNLEIGYDMKSELIKSGTWEQEVLRLVKLPEHNAKSVVIDFKRNQTHLEISIEDQGSGFDWENYLTFDPNRAADTHGRGIAMAIYMSFSELSYNEQGNKVIGLIKL